LWNSPLAASDLPAYEQSGAIFASPAIDFTPVIVGDDRDLDNNPHDQSVPAISAHTVVADI
jgi:hypothetical protein